MHMKQKIVQAQRILIVLRLTINGEREESSPANGIICMPLLEACGSQAEWKCLGNTCRKHLETYGKKWKFLESKGNVRTLKEILGNDWTSEEMDGDVRKSRPRQL